MNDETVTKEFDLLELLSGSVASVADKLPDLSDAVLAELHDLEEKGGKRTTLLSAIDHEIKRRTTASGDDGAADSDPEGEAEPVFTQAEVDAKIAEHRAEHDAELAEHRAEHDAELAKLRGELEAARAGAHDGEAAAEAKGGFAPMVFDRDADFARAALTGTSRIVFVGADDRPIGALPVLEFSPRDYEPDGGRVKLKREIEFPREVPETQVAGAFLLDDDDEVSGKAELVQPFGIGAGRAAKLPGGTLSFAGPEAFTRD